MSNKFGAILWINSFALNWAATWVAGRKGHAKVTLTTFYIANRGPTIKAENFPDRWIQHAALFASFNLERAPYTSGNYLLIERGEDFEPTVKCGFVGISIMTLNDLGAVKRFADKYRDAIKKMKVDEAEAFGGDIDLTTCYGDRHVVVDGPRTEFALILLRQRKPEVSDSKFHGQLMDLVKRILALVGDGGYPDHVAHTHITQFATATVDYSGMTELWFKSMEDVHACMAAMNSAGFAAAESNWTIAGRSVTVPTSLVKKNTV